MGVTWTKEQQQVIDLREHNILVSAAAGSGKTAVLVERIITRLTRDPSPLDVDQLLVVTFTEAAAAEMKERIKAAIEKALKEHPSDTHLKKQSALIHTAKVTTIHSFCLSVIREYFHTIDLDPGFRIAEEGELKLLRQDVMRDFLEARYEEGSEAFFRFVETFATGRDDTKLEEMILELYDYAGSYPDPKGWLLECLAGYREVMEPESIYMKEALSYIHHCLDDIQDMMKRAHRICLEEAGPYMYEKTVESDEAMLQGAVQAEGFEELYTAFGGKGKLEWSRLATNRDSSVDKDRAEELKALREDWKKIIGDLKKTYFFQPPEEMKADLKICYPVMEVLIDLVLGFSDAFAQKKRAKNLIDFRDMEQFALEILTKVTGGKRVPSETAEEYQAQFAEVMIDEYQDSNLLQEAILTSVSRISKGEHNLFMVGDVKQSIYSFRLSRPELFMEKYEAYQSDGEGSDGCRRIDLHKNFRSRAQVLNAANGVFAQIMTKNLGGIAYDEKAALYVGADYPPCPGDEMEVLVIDTEKEEEEEKATETNREIEARAAALKIREMLDQQEVWDAKADQLRPIRYSDIVILTRSVKGWTDVFAKVFAQEGIPTYTSSKEGYFGTLEIGWVMDYLKVLDNFRQDIPLAAVLKSPFGGCTNAELARIKERDGEAPFYQAVLDFKETKEEEYTGVMRKLWQKIRCVFGFLEEFRRKVPYTPIHELLQEILEETGYLDYVSAMPGGEQRRANLEMLVVKAKAFEATSYKGLFHFLRYISQLKKYDVDFGEAGMADEKRNAVRLMSIHKSKGLEFPVVIVAGMGKMFNTQDLRRDVVIHPELGLGMDAVDLKQRTKSPTFLKKVVQEKIRLENLGEELRVLYVAMTRAKEKLILLGTASKIEEKMAGNITFTKLSGARSYWDWVLPAVSKLPDHLVKLQVYRLSDLVQSDVRREREDSFQRKLRLQALEDAGHVLAKSDPAFAKRLMEQFDYRYPFAGEEQMKLKYTVSELKKRVSLSEEPGEFLIKEEDVVPLIPKFLQKEEGLKGASRGSAYHKVLELLDFSGAYDEAVLRKTIAGLQKEGRISAEMAECILPRDLLAFLQTNSGKRMHAAAAEGKLHKEQPFVFGIDASEIYPDTSAEELVLIQGIIDVYWEEADGLVVLDYKTDRVTDGQELVDKYQEQLHLYARALEQITQKKVKEKVIYSFTLKEEITI